ncbi:membrane trafficking regulatory protein [Lithospermum erythrorhizon]|uniref:Membrane trafficking regulatory protein n=1 Tax=Lithospermum erythrorhizon TaxID=34254 RepID=A0AAV3RAM2_LITER
MSALILREFTKQASFFLKEKLNSARLALTDVTPAQLLAEEAMSENPGGPDTRILKMISKAAFEVDDYWRIVEILHKRLAQFNRRNWRVSYKALIVLEHLLTQGPKSIGEEFQSDKDVIKEMGNLQYIDEKGYDWGLNVRKKSENILKLLENRNLLKEERTKARKITRGIEGFGSFNERNISGSDINCNQDDAFSSRKLGKLNSLFTFRNYQMSKEAATTSTITGLSSSKENMDPEDEQMCIGINEDNPLIRTEGQVDSSFSRNASR